MQNQNNIELSIVIPTFNAAGYIKKALTSIIDQDFSRYEIVVLDNLSTDNTLKIIEDVFTDSSRIRIYPEKDSGIYYAMNKGISLARGTWVYFMGADDSFINAEVLKNVAKHLNEENDIVYGNVTWMPQDKKEEGEWGYLKLLNQNINHQRIFYRKSLFEKHGNYNTAYKIASDHELNNRLFCNAAIKKKYVDIDIALYHANGFSANKVDEKFWADWKSIVRKNFAPYLTDGQIYGSLKKYYWYALEKKNYTKAFKIFSSILYHTHSISFVKSTISYLVKGTGSTNRKAVKING